MTKKITEVIFYEVDGKLQNNPPIVKEKKFYSARGTTYESLEAAQEAITNYTHFKTIMNHISNMSYGIDYINGMQLAKNILFSNEGEKFYKLLKEYFESNNSVDS